MRSPMHLATIRGLGPDGDELTDDDIVEVDGEAPPPSSARPRPTVSGAYRIVAARRTTLRGTGQE